MLLTHSALFSEENEAGPRILIRSSPPRPVEGSTWTLTLFIAHDEPNEVDVLAPHFDEALFLEQVIKAPRLVNPAAAGTIADITAYNETSPEDLERWTAMEYRFGLNSPGTIGLDAFTVITPQGQTKTPPFNVSVQRLRNTAETQSYQFVWEGLPSGLKTGENAVFTLRYNGNNYAGSLPEAGLFLPSVPPGHILESLPLTPEEKSAGIALKLRLISLEANSFALARRQFSYNGAVFEVPSLRIPVTQAAENARKEQTAPENRPTPPPPPPDPPNTDPEPRPHKFPGGGGTH
jgi:hypothetical protein